MSNVVETITRETFLKYLKERKNLDKSYGKTVIECYKKKEAKDSALSSKLKAKMETDSEFRERTILKRKEAYQKRKDKLVKPKKEIESDIEIEQDDEIEIEQERDDEIKRNDKISKPFVSNFVRLNLF